MEELSFFKHMAVDDKAYLAENDSFFFRNFDTGEYLIHQDEEDQSLFVLMAGKARVVKEGSPGTPLAILTPGAVFGEIAFLTKAPRTTSVIAEEPVTVFQLTPEQFSTLDTELTVKIQANVIQTLLGRIEKMNTAILRLSRVLSSLQRSD
jgi:CRP-like cAMP-binding protein